MSTAPPNLLAVRAQVREHTGLTAVETGIVGDDAHDGGYHCGRSGVDSDDYSVRESSRDRNSLTEYACAFDEGWWELRVGGKTHNLRTHSIWMVAQCKAGAPDTKDIREIIYSPDGKVVKRWDRLGKRSTGDSSHLKHTHRSYFRDAIKAGRALTALDRRYFTEIGLLAGEDDDVTPADAELFVKTLLDTKLGQGTVTVAQSLQTGTGLDRQIAAAVAELTGRPLVDVDEQAIVAGILSVLTPAAIAAAIPDSLAGQVADELAARLGS